MGVSDCTTVYGNRDGAQEGLNFDHLDKSEKDPNGVPDFPVEIDSETMRKSEMLDCMRPFSANMAENTLRAADDCLGNTIEGTDLAIEVFLVESREWPKMPESFSRAYDETERIFVCHVRPYALKTDVYTATADCSDWVFCPTALSTETMKFYTPKEIERMKKGTLMDRRSANRGCYYEKEYYGKELPKPFHYFEYGSFGIFKFKGDDYNKDDDTLTPKDLFPEIDESKQEVWMRVWYNQVYEGFVQKEEYTSFVTDPCLVWTCYELGILGYDEIPKQSRKWLWNEARRLILQRQYPDKYYAQYIWPLLLGYCASPKCPFYKESTPLDVFLSAFEPILGADFIRNAKESRTIPTQKRRKVEERNSK